jgi:hypothetical protein
MTCDMDALLALNKQHIAELRRDAEVCELARLARRAEAGKACFVLGSAIKRGWLNLPRLEVRLVRRNVATWFLLPR